MKLLSSKYEFLARCRLKLLRPKFACCGSEEAAKDEGPGGGTAAPAAPDTSPRDDRETTPTTTTTTEPQQTGGDQQWGCQMLTVRWHWLRCRERRRTTAEGRRHLCLWIWPWINAALGGWLRRCRCVPDRRRSTCQHFHSLLIKLSRLELYRI